MIMRAKNIHDYNCKIVFFELWYWFMFLFSCGGNKI